MTSTVFQDFVTPVVASWLNDVDTSTYATVPANTAAIAAETLRATTAEGIESSARVAGDNARPTSTVLAAANGASLVGFTDGQGVVGTLAGLSSHQVIKNTPSSGSLGFATLKVGTCAGTEGGWTSNPAATDFVTLYPYISSSAVRNRVWAINPIVDIPSGSPATAWGMELNVNVGTANAPDAHATGHAIGIDLVSGGPFAPSVAYSTLSTTSANRWKHGIQLENIGGQVGSTLIRSAGSLVSVDYGVDLSSATINYQGIRIGSTPTAQVAGIGVRQFADGNVGLHLQRFTDTAPTGNLFQVTNAANSLVLSAIDASGNLSATSIQNTPIGATTPATGKFTSINGTTVQVSNGFYAANRLTSNTAPTIASGFGTTPSIVVNNGTLVFKVNVGTGGTASSGVITMPAANAGWAVSVSYDGASTDMRTYATSTSTTSITLTNQTSSTGATVAWPSGTVLTCIAVAY